MAGIHSLAQRKDFFCMKGCSIQFKSGKEKPHPSNRNGRGRRGRACRQANEATSGCLTGIRPEECKRDKGIIQGAGRQC